MFDYLRSSIHLRSSNLCFTCLSMVVPTCRPESKFIQKILKVIADKVRRTALDGAPCLIGIDYRARDINLWLQDRSPGVDICVVCGMGGIGKTTIAKFVFNLNANLFEASSFLANIREISKEPSGLLRLQKQMLSDILRRKHERISSVEEGITKIRGALCDKQVLLVLDDVDQIDQLSAILGMQDLLYPGSRIVITTRHEWLLKPHESHKVYNVEALEFYESLKLFSWYAFGQDHPLEGYLERSKKVMKLCAGLPLALRVLGSSLSGKDLDVWDSVVKKLEVIPDYQILEKLKLSYDSLQDDHDRSLFLDIACFFVGSDRDVIVRILDECDFFTVVGIQNLIDRSLLTIDECNKLVMHQMVRDMGRGIVRQESSKDPGKRSRLWHHKDSFKILKENTGTEAVEGITLDMQMFTEDQLAIRNGTMDDAKKQIREEYLGQNMVIQRRYFGFFSRHSIGNSSRDSGEFQTNAFAKMQDLRLLKLNNVHLTGRYKVFPKRLRLLSWRRCLLKSIPRDFPLESLVVIDMRYSSLKQIWYGIMYLSFLKILNLSHSWGLTKTPNFSGLSKLEKLILKDCTSLVELHETIGSLEGLVVLNLKDCRCLSSLPRNIGLLKSLENLDISGCSSLQLLPVEFSLLTSLKSLNADGIAMSQILATTNNNQPSSHAFFRSWISKPRISSMTSWVSLPRTLVSLSLVDCNLSDDAFAMDFSNLSMLQNLDLTGNPIHALPESIKGLSRLESFSVKSCEMLKSLIGLPTISELFIDNCKSLEMITYNSSLTKLPTISHAFDNNNLVMVQGVFKLANVENVDGQFLENFGLDLESLKNTVLKVDHHTSEKKKKLPLQVLFESGVSTIFLHGNKIPSWFAKAITNSVSFSVSPLVKVGSLNLAAVYARTSEPASSKDHKYSQNAYFESNRATIHNRTKDLEWIHKPTIFGFPENDNEDMTWLSHWKFGNLLDAGDEVTITVSVTYRLRVKEIGVHIVCEEEEQDPPHGEIVSQHPFVCRDVVPGDVSQRGGRYNLPTWAGRL